MGAGLDDRKGGEDSWFGMNRRSERVGAEILAPVESGSDDLVGGVSDSEQRGMDPAGTQIGTQDFPIGLNGERMGISAEVDFPTLAAENGVLHLPRFGKAGQQPEADGFVALVRGNVQSEPGFFEAAELAQRSDDDGPIASGGLVRTMIGRHLWKHETWQWFLNLQVK